MLVKHFGEDKEEGGTPRCDALEKTRIMGEPDMDEVSTSIAERHNLTMRMCMRRFTRKTNAFSKKLAYHRHAVSLYFMFYNFCRIHQTLRVTPAMEAGVTDRLWDLGLACPSSSQITFLSALAFCRTPGQIFCFPTLKSYLSLLHVTSRSRLVGSSAEYNSPRPG